jgi:hypothetical protein
MSARPGCVKAEIAVDLPHPRSYKITRIRQAERTTSGRDPCRGTFRWSSTLFGTSAEIPALQEMRKRFQRCFGNVMLDPLGVGLSDLGWDT